MRQALGGAAPFSREVARGIEIKGSPLLSIFSSRDDYRMKDPARKGQENQMRNVIFAINITLTGGPFKPSFGLSGVIFGRVAHSSPL
jgi:hypothetical protein